MLDFSEYVTNVRMTDELRTYALRGARARLVEIDAEREKLLAMFPELGPRRIKRATEPTVLYEMTNGKHDGPSFVGGGGYGVEKTRKSRSSKLHSTHGRKHSDEFKAAAVARYKAGEKPSAIQRALKLGSATLYKWLRDAGVKSGGGSPDSKADASRQVQGNRGRAWHKATAPTLTALASRDDGRATPAMIAKDSGATLMKVSWRLRSGEKAGLLRRASKGVYEITPKGRAALEAGHP